MDWGSWTVRIAFGIALAWAFESAVRLLGRRLTARIAQRTPQPAQYKGKLAIPITPSWLVTAFFGVFAGALSAGTYFWCRLIWNNWQKFSELDSLLIAFGVAVAVFGLALALVTGYQFACLLRLRTWIFRDGVLVQEAFKRDHFIQWTDIESVEDSITTFTIVERGGRKISFDTTWSSSLFFLVSLERNLPDTHWGKIKEVLARNEVSIDWHAAREIHDGIMSRIQLAACP
ncbi:MAG: hypothetical protein K1Y02_11660 [Candidatus Hydrogenedentes bacterium]|nr:hypothetical protein [Candidatus Hydrogenedentota bacterium]